MSCLNKIGPNDTPCLVGGFDFAGGYLHIASGFAGLAYCILVGNRTNYGKK